MAEQLGEAVLLVRADTKALEAGLAQSRQKIEGVGRSSQEAAGKLGSLERAFGGVGNTLRNLAGLVGIVGFGALVQQIGQTGRESERSKLQLQALAGAYGEATQAAQSVARVQKLLSISALDARRDFSSLFAALRGTGLGIKELEVLFVGVSKAARLSGSGTQEAAAGLLQLKQGLASGRFQGDELRSVLENIPVLGQEVSRVLGQRGITGDIRNLGAEGKITADIVFEAAKRLATANVPARASAEQLSLAYTDLKEKAAEAFGPAVVDVVRNVSAGIQAFATFLKNAKEPLTAVGRLVVTVAKELLPLAIGFGAVSLAVKAFGLAIKAAALAKAALLALAGPKGWAVLITGLAGTALAADALERAYKGVADAAAAAKGEAAKAQKEFAAVVGSVGNVGPTGVVSETQKQISAVREYKSLLDQLQAVRLAPKLLEQQQASLQRELQLQQQIRKVEDDRVSLRNKLAKPIEKQSKEQVLQLEQQIRNGEVQTAIVREQNRQADAEALRNQQERIRQQGLEKANADAKLSSTEQLTELERQALATGVEVAQTTRLRLELQERIGQVLREQQAAQEALAAEQSRPRGEQNATVLESLFDRLRAANANVLQAYGDAGQALVKNAREAATALRSAAENIQSILRGGFEFLTPQLQAAQVNRARASIQPLVDRGVIRTGLDISTPEKLFQLASFAESFSKGEQQLQQALSNNAEATQALIRKDWNVYVQVPAPAPALPTPRA